MLGLIAGDIAGSVYEWKRCERKDFPLFQSQSRWTDDTVLALAVAEAILTGIPYGESLRSFGRRYPRAGYGGRFRQWLAVDDAGPYNSWGNGSGMRVAAVGYAFESEEDVLREAAASASPTHNHPEGIKGAQAVALAVFLARRGASKEEIREAVSGRFGYDLNRTVEGIRPGYSFDVSCRGSVPEAIIAFLDSVSFEDAVRNAVFLGGDSDTLAAMAGAVAEAWYGGVPREIRDRVTARLPGDLLDVLERFTERFVPVGIAAGTGEVVGPLEG